MKIFVSYCHRQADWVRSSLVPVIEGTGAEVLIDVERFKAGIAVEIQMDAEQDKADRQVLVFSPEYFKSKACKHELKRALAIDPIFQNFRLLPVLREGDSGILPSAITKPNPLWIDLRDHSQADSWKLLVDGWDGDLGMPVPTWLEALTDVGNYLIQGHSVSLVTRDGTDWRSFLRCLEKRHHPLPKVDLSSFEVATRSGMLTAILRVLGVHESLPPPPDDLVSFGRAVRRVPLGSRIVLLHFDRVRHRLNDDIDFFDGLRNLISDERRLVVLFQSRQPFDVFLPKTHPISQLDLKTVVLGRSK